MTRDKDDSLRWKVDIYRTREVDKKHSMMLRDNERSLIELIQSLDKKYEGLLVVVEGSRDVAVLRDLGLKAPIVKTQSKLSRHQMVEQIAAKAGERGQVLIMTDFDDEGTEICNYIERTLEPTGVKTLKGVRIRIRRLMGNWRCIEELGSLFKRRDSPESESV